MSTATSIVDYLNSKGQASDYNTRAKLAATNGIQNYTGTAAQNTQLLGILNKSATTNTTAKTSTPTNAGTTNVPDGSGRTIIPAPATSNTTPAKTTTIVNTDNLSSTGNESLDKIEKSIADMINTNPAQYQIPANLQITPALTATFLNWAHQAVDPQTQQLIQAEAANINTSLKNAQTQYELNAGQTIQNYGTDLAAQDEAAAGKGVAFSGARGLADTKLTDTTNRTLASLGATTAANIGNTLQAGGAQVGTQNTGLFNVPTLSGMSVNNTNNTGINTTGNTTGNLGYNYNPSIYTAGTIPTSQNTALGNLQSNYLTQYSNLAANNSNGSRSMNDLLGMISGAPANASNNLM